MICTVEVNNKTINLLVKEKLFDLNLMYLKSNEKVAYYYKDIKNGDIFSYNENILFYAASAIKILVCAFLLEEYDKHTIDVNDKLLVTMGDLKQDTGVIKCQEKDTEYSILELIRLTIVESDNTAYLKLVNFVGKEKLIEYGKSLGALHTLEGKDLFGLINCKDMLIYWQKVKEVVENNSLGDSFKEWLLNPSFKIVEDESIDSNPYVRKYGSWDIAYHEAGYVEGENPYYLIILTQKFKLDSKEKFVNETARRLSEINKMRHNV